jgi:dihydroorotate dehydrogenase electron transfer subunit
LDLRAPLGHAIDFDLNARHILLVGEEKIFAPLIAIAHEAIAHGRAVVLAISNAPAIGHLLAPEIEYRADEVLNADLIAWADALVASGTLGWYHNINDAIRAVRYRLEAGFARGLIDVPMPCGAGQCYACTIDTARGVKLVCEHGAWFDLFDVENRSAR